MPNAAAARPVMCSALVRDTGERSAEASIAASVATQGQVNRVCHTGKRRVATIEAPHARNATSTHASRLLIDWPGSRTSGLVVSNGATNASRATPTNAVFSMRPATSGEDSKKLATRARRHACCIRSGSTRQSANNSGIAYGGRKLVSLRETYRIQGLRGRRGEGIDLRHHRGRRAAADGGRIRRVLPGVHGGMAPGGRDRLRDSAARGARGRARTGRRDRKSTRLNSSHQIISYAVFCLKKKK